MRRIATSWLSFVAAASMVTSLVVTAPPSASAAVAPAARLITVADAPLRGLVTDNGDRAYASGPGRIEVLKISTGTLQAPIPVPFLSGDLDVSPDGSLLYVGDRTAGAIAVFDVALRTEVRRYPLGITPDRLAVASNGAALVYGTDATFKPFLKQLNLVTGAVSDRGPLSAGTGNFTLTAQFMRSSRDHSRIVVFGGAVSVYRAATDTFVAPRSFGLGSAPAAIDGDGSTILLNPGTRILDEHLVVQATIPTIDSGQFDALAVDNAGTTAYRSHGSTIEVLDLPLDRVTATIAIPEPVDFWEQAVSNDGATVVALAAHGIILAPVAAAVPKPACTPSSPAPMVVGVCGRLADVVVDGHGHAFATNPDRDQVEVITLATGAREAPIPVGSQPRGLDLSPDGSTLYVAVWGSNEVAVIDVASRSEVRRIPIPEHPHPYWTGPFAIAVADNGTALLTTSLNGLRGAMRFLQVNLAAGTTRTRADFDLLVQQDEGPEVLRASADHSLIVGASQWGQPVSPTSGVVTLYRSADDTITPWAPTPGPPPVGVAVGGSHILALPGAVLGTDLAAQRTIPDGGKAVAVDPTGTLGYRVQETTVDILDLAAGLKVGSVALPEPVGAGRGLIALTPDGAKLVVLTRSGLSIVAAGPTTFAPKSAYSVWSQPTAAGLDAVGTWAVPVNVPEAAAGQLPPSYLYAHYFNFTQSPSALGVVGLVTSAGTRLAAFGIVDGAGNPHSAGLPFDWLPGRAYYLFAAQLAPTSFGGWVYDYTAATWTFIGQVDLPAPLGKIAPATITQAIWFGPSAPTCAAYPKADVYFYPPVGYAGGGTMQAPAADVRVSATGVCPATATTELAPWAHLRLGADLT